LNFINIHRHQIFPISYYKCNIKDNDKIKSTVVPKILEDIQKIKNNIPKGWSTNKLITSFSDENNNKNIFFHEDGIFYSILEKPYFECFDKFFDHPYEIKIPDMWYNCYYDGEYQESHDHLGSIFNSSNFSCIHFLSFDKIKHYPPVFEDPLLQIRNSTSIEFFSHDYEDHYKPVIEEGDFMMFPSYLRHEVLPSSKTLDYPRITISFNIQILKYANLTVN